MKLLGPHGVLGTADESAYEQRQRDICAARGEFLTPRSEQIIAFVSAGRWVGDCPICAAGISLHRDWVARCYGCGAIFANVQWPEKFDEIETVLVERPARNTQNFMPTETIADLISENERHGLIVERKG